MTRMFFMSQVDRMKKFFGAEPFHNERLALVWPEVKELPDENFRKIVDQFIGERKPSWPPAVSDFREKSEEQRKIVFQSQVQKAFGTLQKEARKNPDNKGLLAVLDKMGVDSLMDAVFKKQRNNGGQS